MTGSRRVRVGTQGEDGRCPHLTRGVVYSLAKDRKRRTHDHGGVRWIGQPGDVSGFGYSVSPTELHVDPDRDVVELVVFSIISVSRRPL